MTHPLDATRFANIPEEITPEEFRRRIREHCDEILKQLDDPDYYRRHYCRPPIMPPRR